MCLIGLALQAHRRFPLVIAANRDEHFDRPTAPLDWWRASPGGPWLLGGRDLAAGGTWLALSEQGRIAMLTNVRDPARHRDDARSRGALVTVWLEGREVQGDGYNPFNLVGGDLGSGRWSVRSDGDVQPHPIEPGLHVLSNAALNTPWPKARRLRETLDDALARAASVSALADALWRLLADRTAAPDHELPDTGVGRERERMLSPVFIATPDGRYGTRSGTVVIGERSADGNWRLHLRERTHDAQGRTVQERQVTLDGWPQARSRPAVAVLDR